MRQIKEEEYMKFTMVQARAMAGLTQAEVAKRMGITAPALHYYEKGKVKISDEKFDEFCRIVGMKTGQVLIPETIN